MEAHHYLAALYTVDHGLNNGKYVFKYFDDTYSKSGVVEMQRRLLTDLMMIIEIKKRSVLSGQELS